MAVKIGHAVHNEYGEAFGGKPGDQTGKEVLIADWYQTSKKWHTVLRPKDSVKAAQIAAAAEVGCKNENIGYNQGDRTSLYTAAKAVGFDLAKVKTKCNTDCSAFVAVCSNAAGITVSKDIYTGNMVSALMATGAYTKLTESKYLTSSDYLQTGDILVKDGHTAIVLGNGAKVPKQPYIKAGTAMFRTYATAKADTNVTIIADPHKVDAPNLVRIKVPGSSVARIINRSDLLMK